MSISYFWFTHLTLYWAYDYLSMMGLKFNHANKRGPGQFLKHIFCKCTCQLNVDYMLQYLPFPCSTHKHNFDTRWPVVNDVLDGVLSIFARCLVVVLCHLSMPFPLLYSLIDSVINITEFTRNVEAKCARRLGVKIFILVIVNDLSNLPGSSFTSCGNA